MAAAGRSRRRLRRRRPCAPGAPRASASRTASSQSRSAIAAGVARAGRLTSRSSRRSACSKSASSSSVSIVSMSAPRVDPPVGMRHAALAVAADDVADRVGLADRAEEPVAEALALRGPLDQPGDVVELDRHRDQLRAADRRADLRESLVGDGGDRHVRARSS